MVLSYAGFTTYLLFPAAPPWLAHEWGILSETVTAKNFGHVASTLMAASPNQVAAMPSLHMAFPTFIAAIGWWIWGRRSWPLLLIPPAVVFATIYLGHHYVVDLIAGAAYGLLATLVARRWNTRLNHVTS